MAKTYTVQHPCDVEIGVHHFFDDTEDQSDPVHGLWAITSSDPAENARLQEGGEFECWDAGMEMKDGRIEFHGNEGPSGYGDQVTLVVPLNRIRSLVSHPM